MFVNDDDAELSGIDQTPEDSSELREENSATPQAESISKVSDVGDDSEEEIDFSMKSETSGTDITASTRCFANNFQLICPCNGNGHIFYVPKTEDTDLVWGCSEYSRDSARS